MLNSARVKVTLHSMAAITLFCYKHGIILPNICNIFIKKFTKRKIISSFLFLSFTGAFIWILCDIEQKNLRSRFDNYVTPKVIVKRPYRDVRQRKDSHQFNTSTPNGIDDILTMKRPYYLSNFKNPCWYTKPDGKYVKRRCLPYFYLIGVDKCGTTDLFSRMLQHPQILRTNAVNSKETHWWSWRRFGYDVFINDSKIQHFDDYLKVFDPTSAIIKGNQIFGDGSPTYFWDFTGWPLIPQNKGRKKPKFLTPDCIYHLTPKAKFILILRNPIERLYSDYLFLIRGNVSSISFHDGVMHAMKLFTDCERQHGTRWCLFNKALHMHTYVRLLIGMYGYYLLEWLNVFSRDQFLIIKTEEYRDDIAGHLKKIFKFLGVSSLNEHHLKTISSGRHAFERSDHLKEIGPMLPTTRILLKQFYSRSKYKINVILKDQRFIWN